MTTPERPLIECEQEHASLAVKDVHAALDFQRRKKKRYEIYCDSHGSHRFIDRGWKAH